MNGFITVCAILQLWLQMSFADLSIIEPKQYQSFKMSKDHVDVDVGWKDSFSSPSVASIYNYTLILCNGTNNKIKQVKTIKKGLKVDEHSNSYKYKAQLDCNGLADGVFFIQLVGEGKNFHSIHYTHRFELYSTTESHNEELVLEPPAAEVIFKDQEENRPTSIDSHSYMVPYLQQTGDVKYAPFQKRPQTTKKSGRWKGESSIKISSSKIFGKKGKGGSIPPPNVQYTITQPVPTTYSTEPNTITGVSTQPIGYDPSLKVSKPTTKSHKSIKSIVTKSM